MKKIFFALLSASMVLFAACQQEPSVKVSDGAEVLGYKPSTYDITVESVGGWTLEGNYDWIEAELNIQSVNKNLLKNCNLKFYFG